MEKRSFKPVTLEEVPDTYTHPYTLDEVLAIKERFKKLAASNFSNITLEDQKLTIIPHVIIHRTEVFCLKVKLVKEKVVRVAKPKVVKEKVVKEKKLTNKQYQEKLMSIIIQKAQGLNISEEDSVFYEEHLNNEGVI